MIGLRQIDEINQALQKNSMAKSSWNGFPTLKEKNWVMLWVNSKMLWVTNYKNTYYNINIDEIL